MSRTRTVNGTAYHVTTNYIERPTFYVRYDETEGWVRSIDPLDTDITEGFEYRGNVYASSEFEWSGHDFAALGFDGVQAQSAWDAIALQYYDRDGYTRDGVVVAHIHW